jgi:hypothetical protein
VAKTVQLSDDAYATLRALKKPGESFSDTVKRLAAARKDPMALLRLGALERAPGHDPGRVRARLAKADRARMGDRLGIALRDDED